MSCQICVDHPTCVHCGKRAPMRLWAADPHQYGPGKIHIVDEKKESKTYCGKVLAACPGKAKTSGKATCKICLDSHTKRPEREKAAAAWAEQSARSRAEYEQRVQQEEQLRVEEHRRWWDKYNRYLKKPEWRSRRALVMKRCGGVCEGCGIQPAVQVHHLTYQHVCDEFLWELRGVCNDCHDRFHGEGDQR